MKKTLVILLTLFAVIGAACSKSEPTTTTSTATSSGQAGGNEALATVLASAPDQTDQVGSFKMTFSFSMSGLGSLTAGQQIPGLSGDSADLLTGTGQIDTANQRSDITMTIMGAGAIQMIQDGDVIYMKAPFLTQMLGTQKDWVKIDPSTMSAEDFASMSGGQGDPSQMLESLRGVGSVTDIGTETIDGVETTHYNATIDLSKAMGDVPADQQAEVEAAFAQLEQMGMSSIPVDVWIDGDGLPRKMVMSFELDPSKLGIPASPGTEAQKITMTMTFGFSAFGEPVSITVPPKNQVEDMSKLGGLGIPSGGDGSPTSGGYEPPTGGTGTMPNLPTDMPTLPVMPG